MLIAPCSAKKARPRTATEAGPEWELFSLFLLKYFNISEEILEELPTASEYHEEGELALMASSGLVVVMLKGGSDPSGLRTEFVAAVRNFSTLANDP